MMNRYNFWDSDDSDADGHDADNFYNMDSNSDSDFSTSASHDSDDLDDFNFIYNTKICKSVLDGLNALRKELTFCDVTLTAGDRKFQVHKNILSANCGLFMTMFSGICSETDEEIPIDRIDPDCLELLIECMYTGSLLLDSNNAEEFLSAASFLQMEKLEEFCKDFLEQKCGYPYFLNTTHTSYLLEGLNKFRQSGTFCDFTLNVGERSCRVHKNVISSVSPFFKSICLETNKDEVCLDEVDADILESLIDYIYAGNLKTDQNNVKNMLLTNSRFQILNADNLCCRLISRTVKMETFVEYWNFSKKNSIDCLRDLLIEKALDICPDLFSETESLKIEFEFEDIKEIIESLKYRGHTEDFIFSFLMRWINRSKKTRENYTNDLLGLLQPSLISPNLFHLYSIPELVSMDDTRECILISSADCRDASWRIDLFSEDEYIEIDFSQLTNWGSSVCHGYYIYHQGGLPPKCIDSIAVTASHVYHPNNQMWTPFVPLLEARYGHSSCVLNQKILNVGGSDRLGRCLASVEFTDLLTEQRAFTDPMPRSRELCGLGVLENSIYVVGGSSDESSFYSDTYRFDEREGLWQSLRPSSSAEFTKSCAVVGTSVYTADRNNLHRYDIRTNEWERIVTQGDTLTSGNVFSVRNTLYGLFEGYIGRYIPEDRRWVKQRTWTNWGMKISSYKVSTNLLIPVI